MVLITLYGCLSLAILYLYPDLTSAQYTFPPSFFANTKTNLEPEIEWKPAPNGTEYEVWQYMRERGNTMFLATLAQGFASKFADDSPDRKQFDECIKTAYNSRIYANCLLPLMHRQLREQKLEKETIKRRQEDELAKQKPKNIFFDSSIDEQRTEDGLKIVRKQGSWSDMVLPEAEIPTRGPDPTPNHQDHHERMAAMSANVANFLSELVKHLKNMTGPWNHIPDIGARLKEMKDPQPRLSKNGPQLIGLTKESVKGDDSIFHTLLDNIMTAPLFLMKDSIEVARTKKKSDQSSHDQIRKADQIRRTKRAGMATPNDDNINFLSPRILSMFDDHRSEKPSFLSPDFLSMFDSPNSVASIPKLLSLLPDKQQAAWMQFFMEITGTNDYLRLIETDEFQQLIDLASVTWYGNQTVPYKKLFDAKYISVGEIFQNLSKPQMDEVNQRGFSYMNRQQLERAYGEDLHDPDFMSFDVDEYYKMDQIDKEQLLIDMVEGMATNYGLANTTSFVVDPPPDETEPTRGSRKKRAIAPPCYNAPYSGGTTGVIYFKSVQIVCPSIFSYILLGPLVLSPYVLSPYVMGPFILSPEILNPFILSPYIISPDILNPIIVSPGIINPTVLAPPILSPLVLSPTIISPSVLSPPILSPLILSPGILSPSVGSPNILSPFALSPSILSPAVLFVNVLSPGVLSPSILSPSDGPNILSPCALCGGKRRKRNAYMTNHTRNYFDHDEFSRRLFWIREEYEEDEDDYDNYGGKEKYFQWHPDVMKYLLLLQKNLLNYNDKNYT